MGKSKSPGSFTEIIGAKVGRYDYKFGEIVFRRVIPIIILTVPETAPPTGPIIVPEVDQDTNYGSYWYQRSHTI